MPPLVESVIGAVAVLARVGAAVFILTRRSSEVSSPRQVAASRQLSTAELLLGSAGYYRAVISFATQEWVVPPLSCAILWHEARMRRENPRNTLHCVFGLAREDPIRACALETHGAPRPGPPAPAPRRE